MYLLHGDVGATLLLQSFEHVVYRHDSDVGMNEPVFNFVRPQSFIENSPSTSKVLVRVN